MLAILIALAITGCQDATTNDPTEHDGARLVVLSPALAIMLDHVGGGDLMIGRHDFDQIYTDRPACGHQGGIDYEQVLALDPTHILIEWGARPLPDRLVSLAADHDWSIERTELRTLDDILNATDMLEERFGTVQDNSPASSSLALSWAPSTKAINRVGRVLLLGATNPPGALGPGSFHHEILTSLGGVPAIIEGAPWIQLDAEDIIALAPDAIVLIAPATNGTGIESIGDQAINHLGGIGTLDLPATSNQRVAVLDGVAYLTPSSAMAEFARDLRSVLESWMPPESP